MPLFLLVVCILVAFSYLFRHFAVKGRRFKSHTKLHGKTVIITGSNTGIGKETAIDLAKRGARVIMACRSWSRGECAVTEVRMESGSDQVIFMQLDLASLKSVRSFAEKFLKTESRLDRLINNAGLYMHGKTDDGLGMMFGVNHIGHFLLTHLLLDRLKACAPSRVVNLASFCYMFGSIDFRCLDTHGALREGSSAPSVFMAYCDSKLCNVLFTQELANQLEGTGVTCYSLHPGVIRSELGRYNTKTFRRFTKPISSFFFKNTEEGAQTTLYCTVKTGIEDLSGRYFSNCQVRDVYPVGKDGAVAKRLWAVSERLSGLQ